MTDIRNALWPRPGPVSPTLPAPFDRRFARGPSMIQVPRGHEPARAPACESST